MIRATPSFAAAFNVRTAELSRLGLGLGFALTLFTLGLWASSTAALAQTTVAGVTSGALSVDETGSAGYTIPIAVPPGIAGMQPSLALVYKSHGGNGTAGVGWSLSASSSIHRCAQTLVQDNAIHGVDFSAEDRFCLDGQRLVAVSGVYGADGTEYRTEIDGFARIISHGTAGSGPLSFTVESKSGRTLDYGNTTDSRLGVAGQDEIRLWSLSRVTDPSGNAMTYHYIEDPADKSYRLDKVAYAYDAAITTAKSEVRFLYEARPDTRTSYLAGAELAMTRRLTNIETWTVTDAGLALVKDYRLTYEVSPATERSRITAITECDPSDNCLQPATLGWQGEVPGFDTTVIASDTVTNLWGLRRNEWAANTRQLHVLDHNGDGLSDIILQGQDEIRFNYLLTSNGNGFDTTVIASDTVTNLWGLRRNEWAANTRQLHVLDYNGDGLSDIILQGQDETRFNYLLTSNGSGFDTTVIASDTVTNLWGLNRHEWAHSRRRLHVLDYNGDGLSDIILQGQDESAFSFLLTSNGTGFDKTVIASDTVTNLWGLNRHEWAHSRRRLHVLDYNGDGLSDIILQGQDESAFNFLLTSNGSGFDTTVIASNTVTNLWGLNRHEWAHSRRRLHVLDYNGDGLSDIILQGQDESSFNFLLTSNGSGFDTTVIASNTVTNLWGLNRHEWAHSRRRLHVLDYNGDGLSDIILQGQDESSFNFLLTSNGSGFDTTVIASNTVTNLWGLNRNEWAANTRNLHVLDYNGDGLSDILLQGQDETRFNYLLTHDGPTPDLLTSVTDSLGRVSTIDHTPLTDDTVYTKDADAVFPVVDIRAPLYVVKSVSSDDGLGGQAVTSYSYAGAKVHVQGRGFRGFRQMIATDEQSGIVTTTDYHQVFPYTAQVAQSVKTLADGTTIKTIDNTWDQLSLNGGETVYPYVAASTSEYYEINDGLGNAPVVSRTASAVFDIFGNPTSLTTTTTGGESFTEITVNTYTNDTVNWFLGLLTRSEVTRSRGKTP